MKVFKSPIEQSQSFLTPKGQNALALAKKYGLDKYYDEHANTYTIPTDHLKVRQLQTKVNQFLNENKNYGIRDDGDSTLLFVPDEW